LGETKLVFDPESQRFYEDDPSPIPYEEIKDDIVLLWDRTLDTVEVRRRRRRSL